MRRALFIGRWQPFHIGHQALIATVLKEGKDVVIAIRDTPLSPENPYSVDERRTMIRAIFPNELRVQIITVPDISEVCYGRDVGYTIREIRLEPSIEAVSASEIRRGDVDHR